jgi:molecular chaperone GrpE (heat shock protein)
MTDATHADSQSQSAEQANPAEPEILERLLAAVTGLQRAFESKIRYDEVRERHVEALHQELEAHRRGLYQKILQPLLTDLVGIYDDMTNVLQGLQAPEADHEGGPAEVLARTITSLRDSIEEILSRNGVTRFMVEGDIIDRSRQRVIEVTETEQQVLDRRVACRLRTGFELNGNAFRPEWITAYRYVAAEVKPAIISGQGE